MKKTISLLLSILMLVTTLSFTCAQAFASEAEAIFTVTNTEFSNDEITYTISLASNQNNIKSAILNFEFDNSALMVDEAKSGAVGETTANGFAANVNGIYESGVSYQTNGNISKYVVAFFNPNGISTGSSAKAFVKVTFKAISEDRLATSVKITCAEYITDNDNISKANPVVIDESTFLPLNAVENREVLSSEGGLKFVWGSVTGATEYKIYRRAVGASEWSHIATVPATQTEYMDYISGDALNVEFEYVAEPWNISGGVPHSETGVKGKYFGTIKEIYAEMTETGANVYWSALEGDGPFSYSLWQRAESDADWTYVNTVTSTVCHSKELESGVKYYFTVKAHSGDYLAETSAPDGEVVFLGAPKDAVALIYDDNITLTWSNVAGADSYIVYKMLAGTTTDISSAVVSGTGSGRVSYQDYSVVNGETYTYQIQSVKNNGDMSVRGVKATTVKKLPVTKNVIAQLGKNYITVKWDAAEYAEGYKVLRREANGSAWNAIGSSHTNEYRDVTASNGVYYEYAVATVSGNGAYEAENSIPSAPILYIAAPTITSAIPYSNKISVMWRASSGVDYYDIYKFYPGDNAWRYYATTSTNAYDDYDVVGGNVYGYTVVAYVDGSSSAFDGDGIWVKFLSAPTTFTATNAHNGVNLWWDAAAGAEGYVISRKTGNGTFTEIARVNAYTTSYTDTAAVTGQDNVYSIYAYSGDTVSSSKEATCRYLSSPVLKSVTVTNRNAALLQWESTSGAESYNVYRKACNEGNWVLIGSTASTRYIDSTVFYTNDYVYTVQACYGDSVSSFDPVGLSIVLNVSGTPSLKNVNGTWRCVLGSTYNYAYKGLVAYNGSFYYVENGNVNWNYYGLVAYNNDYYYVSGGSIDFGVTTLVEYCGDWYYVENGYCNRAITTIINYNGTWYYIENGKINWNSDTLVNYGGEWYYAKNGEVAWYYTGLANYNGAWYYVENGCVNWYAVTLASYGNDWYCVSGGTIAWDYTGLINYAGEWYYIQNGYLSFNYTGLVEYGGVWYYVENSMVNWYADTLATLNGEWYYVSGGVINWGYTGLVYFGGEWYYVQNGYLNWGYTGLVEYGGIWYYVENSMVNWYANTLVNHNGDWYCVNGGTIAWDYTGLVYYNGEWYYVENGYLGFGYTGLVEYGGEWYYVENSMVNWYSNTLVNHNGDWYYVVGGTIAWDYTGTVPYGDSYAEVVNGYVTFFG